MLHTIQTRRPFLDLMPKNADFLLRAAVYVRGSLLACWCPVGGSLAFTGVEVYHDVEAFCCRSKETAGFVYRCKGLFRWNLFGCTSSAKLLYCCNRSATIRSLTCQGTTGRWRRGQFCTCLVFRSTKAWWTTGNRWIGRTQWQQADQVSRMCQSLFTQWTVDLLTTCQFVDRLFRWCALFQKSVSGLARSGKDLWNWRGRKTLKLRCFFRIRSLFLVNSMEKSADRPRPWHRRVSYFSLVVAWSEMFGAEPVMPSNLSEDWSLGLTSHLPIYQILSIYQSV